jgi:heat shock protein HslJ
MDMNRTFTPIVLILLVVPLLVACAAAGPDVELPEDEGGAEGEAPLQGANGDAAEEDAAEEESAEMNSDALELAGTSWLLLTLNGEPLIEDTEITLEFTETDAAGNAGCNHYSGAYTLDGDALTVEEIISTMMACLEPEGIMDQEAQFLALLNSAESYEIEGSTLTIMSGDGQGLVFRAE